MVPRFVTEVDLLISKIQVVGHQFGGDVAFSSLVKVWITRQMARYSFAHISVETNNQRMRIEI